MNNELFIQELKEKREEYGVSQSRLAVACGISREYYNRIENGRAQLTEELKQEITKQLGRFNPDEPLFLLIDYFRVRFPTTDALTIIKDVLHIKLKHMLHEDYGQYGYEEQYFTGNIVLLFKSKKKVRKPESEWFRVENTHEPIIDKEVFYRVLHKCGWIFSGTSGGI